VDTPGGILNADGSFYQYGQPLPPNQLIPGPAPLQDSVVDPHQVDPRYQHATLGFERRVAPNTVISGRRTVVTRRAHGVRE